MLIQGFITFYQKVAPILFSLKNLLASNKFVTIFVSTHLLFAIALGRLFALAPDEGGYLYTFKGLYGPIDGYIDPNPQLNSGWITAPKSFLWISYLPAKFLTSLGVPDYLSIRVLSIGLATVSLILILNFYHRRVFESSKLILVCFFIPSIFLWSSVGLRETFIFLELTLVFRGFDYLLAGQNIFALTYLSLGSYALISTKSYLYICILVAMIFLVLYLTLKKYTAKKVLLLIAGIGLIPALLFATTTSWPAVQFMFSGFFHTDPNSVGERSGDSVAVVNIIKGKCFATLDGSKTVTLSGQGEIINSTGKCFNDENQSITVTGTVKIVDKRTGSVTGSVTRTGTGTGTGTGTVSVGVVQVTFHGDTTLISLHYYLGNHPSALLTRILNILGVGSRIEKIWNDKVALGLISKGNEVYSDSSSINSYQLKSGNTHNPLSIVKPAALFLLGPFPFLGHSGIALSIIALESPLWWLLYLYVGLQLARNRRGHSYGDPLVIFAGLVFLLFVVLSALVEVNLGTSFRHRSIILVPLIFLYLQVRAKSQELAE